MRNEKAIVEVYELYNEASSFTEEMLIREIESISRYSMVEILTKDILKKYSKGKSLTEKDIEKLKATYVLYFSKEDIEE